MSTLSGDYCIIQELDNSEVRNSGVPLYIRRLGDAGRTLHSLVAFAGELIHVVIPPVTTH